jgi:hypothetical protein
MGRSSAFDVQTKRNNRSWGGDLSHRFRKLSEVQETNEPSSFQTNHDFENHNHAYSVTHTK